MYQYVTGQLMKEKGYRVKYDISWFDDYGMDNGAVGRNKRFIRNFDLLRAFPGLDIKFAAKFEIKYWKKFFNYVNKSSDALNFLTQTPPIYLGGYQYKEHTSLYKKYFSFDEQILDKKNKDFLSKIRKEKNSVCVHVRRGDMAITAFYWITPPNEYFVQAINLMKNKFPDAHFFFFSDELDFVQDNIIPLLEIGTNYTFVTGNGSDRGYVDLFLCSECKHQIASQGSLGKFGYYLNKYNDKILVTPENIKTLER
jgi:hypothetical protein